jgi:predicted DNA-binding transcriptional regulator AlpA
VTNIILRRREAMHRVGLKSSAFDELRKRSDFPKPIYITARSPGWLERELDAFIDRLIAERDASGGAQT